MSRAWRLLGVVFYWASWPALVVLVPLTRRARILVRYEEEILLVMPWHGPGDYGLPGGGKKWRETGRQAAARELREETGISLNENELKDMGGFTTRARLILSRLELYELNLDSRPTVNPRALEIVNYRWANVAKVRSGSFVSGEARQIIAYCDKI